MNKETQRACRHTWAICWGAACAVHGSRAPTPEYAEAAARLLYMTAAHESAGFRYRRQLGFKSAPDSFGGAFGLWQMEMGSAKTSLDWLVHRPEVGLHADQWLALDPAYDGFIISACAPREVCSLAQLPGGDRLACVFARLHYMWFTAKPIPTRPEDQAVYAKQYWNTMLGSASAENYLDAFTDYWLDEFNAGGIPP